MNKVKKYHIKHLKLDFDINETKIDKSKNSISVTINEKKYSFPLTEILDYVTTPLKDNTYAINYKGYDLYLQLKKKVKTDLNQDNQGFIEPIILSPMPGKIFKILKKPNDKVKSGETILIIEAMKMEHEIKAPLDCVIKNIYFKEGDIIKADDTLIDW